MRCSHEQSTRLLQCDCPTTWKRTTFFAPVARFFDVKCSWIVQFDWSNHFPCRRPDVVYWVELPHKHSKNRYSTRHIADRPGVMIAITLWLRLLNGRQCGHRQSPVSWHQSLTRPTACSPCCSQTTTSHRIESLSAPFFSSHSDLSRHRSVFCIHVALQPKFTNPSHSSNSC